MRRGAATSQLYKIAPIFDILSYNVHAMSFNG